MRTFSFLTLSLLIVSAARAADTRWIGPDNATADWSDPSNWTGGVPNAAKSVLLPTLSMGGTSDTIILPASAMAGDIEVAANYTLLGGTLTATSFTKTHFGEFRLGSDSSPAALTVGLMDLSQYFGNFTINRGSALTVSGTDDSLSTGTGINLNGASLTTVGNASIVGTGFAALQLAGAYDQVTKTTTASDAHIGGNLTVGSPTDLGNVRLYGDVGAPSTLEVDGNVDVLAGNVTSRDSVTTIGGDLTLDGNWLQAAGHLGVGADYNVGTDGLLTLEAGATFSVGGDANVDGTLRLDDPASVATIAGTLTISTTGGVKGTGELDCATVDNHGKLFAGDDAGVIHLTGDLLDESDGTTSFLIAGTTPGVPTGYSQILVDGDTTLAGIAHLEIVPGTTFQVGDQLDLIIAQGNLSGAFGSFDWTGGGIWALSYDSHNVYATLVAAPVPEPTSLAVVGFGAVALLRRRRRR